MEQRKISILVKEHDGEITLGMWEELSEHMKVTTDSTHKELLDTIEFSLNNYRKRYSDGTRDIMLKVGIYDETRRKALEVFDARMEWKDDKPTGNWIGIFPKKDWWENYRKGEDVE